MLHQDWSKNQAHDRTKGISRSLRYLNVFAWVGNDKAVTLVSCSALFFFNPEKI